VTNKNAVEIEAGLFSGKVSHPFLIQLVIGHIIQGVDACISGKNGNESEYNG
jgi:hypothetical protein